MAKKAKTESVLSRETRLRSEADAVSAAAKLAAEAAEQKRVVTPKAERPKKTKKARFVREQAEKKPEKKATSLPERSTTAGGKMMTKNVSYQLQDGAGRLTKGRPRP